MHRIRRTWVIALAELRHKCRMTVARENSSLQQRAMTTLLEKHCCCTACCAAAATTVAASGIGAIINNGADTGSSTTRRRSCDCRCSLSRRGQRMCRKNSIVGHRGENAASGAVDERASEPAISADAPAAAATAAAAQVARWRSRDRSCVASSFKTNARVREAAGERTSASVCRYQSCNELRSASPHDAQQRSSIASMSPRRTGWRPTFPARTTNNGRRGAQRQHCKQLDAAFLIAAVTCLACMAVAATPHVAPSPLSSSWSSPHYIAAQTTTSHGDALDTWHTQPLYAPPPPVSAAVPRALPQPRLRPRRLIIGADSTAPDTLFAQFPGVVRINATAAGFSGIPCTGTLVSNATLLTSPDCFPSKQVTGSTNWNGVLGAATPPFFVQAGDAAATLIGITRSVSYVYAPGSDGYTLALVSFERLPTADALGIVPLHFESELIPEGETALTIGFGAAGVGTNAIGDEVALGAGVMRAATVVVTYLSSAEGRSSNCAYLRRGGLAVVQRLGDLANTARLCSSYGDLGAPLLLRHQSGEWRIAGVLINTDQTPCAFIYHAYTSTVFREQWIREQVARFEGFNYTRPECPKPSPSPTMIPSDTPRPSPSTTPAPSYNMTAPEPLPPRKGLNLLLIILLSCFMALLVAAACFGAYWTRQRMAGLRIGPDHAPTPAKKAIEGEDLLHKRMQQVSGGADAAVKAPRRMSQVAGTQAAEIAAVSAAMHAAHRERRRSSIAANRGEATAAATSIVDGNDVPRTSAAEYNGTGGTGRRGSVNAAKSEANPRRVSMGVGVGRRRSLVQDAPRGDDFNYVHTPGAGRINLGAKYERVVPLQLALRVHEDAVPAAQPAAEGLARRKLPDGGAQPVLPGGAL